MCPRSALLPVYQKERSVSYKFPVFFKLGLFGSGGLVWVLGWWDGLLANILQAVFVLGRVSG